MHTSRDKSSSDKPAKVSYLNTFCMMEMLDNMMPAILGLF